MNWLLANRGRNLVSLIFLCALLYAAFFTGGEAVQKTKRTTTRLLMGTMVSITTWGVEEFSESRAVAKAFTEMSRIDFLMSRHREASPVAKINSSALDRAQGVDLELAQLLKKAQTIQQMSHGAFDPGLGKLVVLWGFSGDEPALQPPGKAEIDAWLSNFQSGGGIELSEDKSSGKSLIRLSNTATALDLGGIAKGYAIDIAIHELKKSGITNALVNAGGDLRGIGSKGGEAWWVGIQHPRDREQIIAATSWPTQSNSGMAMVTSGDYERFFIHNGERYHHILDPKSGYPAKSGLLSVSVQATSATLADGLSTAFFVLGEKESRKLLQTLQGVELLLVRSDGTHWQSKGFQGNWLVKESN
jgi:FAD:protein FMN transferase